MSIQVVGIDGDDTLWHSESLFAVTNERIRELLAPHVSTDVLDERLLDVERRNLSIFGYGAKAFTLSVIETAIEVTHGRVTNAEIQAIIDLGKALLTHPVELLDGVTEAIDALGDRRLVLITKGDLFHQESKVAGSGLGERFHSVQVVSEKNPGTYRRVLDAVDVAPEQFVMVGNSLRSDVEPVVSIGGRAVHVPYEHQWALDSHPEGDLPDDGWWRIDSLAELPALLGRID